MLSVIRCLLRNCFEDNREDDDDNSSTSSINNHSRGFFPSPSEIRTFYMGSEDDHPPTGEEISVQDDCQGDEESSVSTAGASSTGGAQPLSVTPDNTAPVISFLNRLGIRTCDRTKTRNSHPRFIPLGSINDVSSFGALGTPAEVSTGSTLTMTPTPSIPIPGSDKKPILTEAIDFKFTPDKEKIPSINDSEFVMPGSDMQKKMALAMCENLKDPSEDECVICMEGFSFENPRMPTLCGCGENKTYFHLPCLYQWTEQNRNCPSCRKRLRWEEF